MSCATEPCAAVLECPLVGGCVVRNPQFVQPTRRELIAHQEEEGLRDDAPALNGTKPARHDAHPSTKHKSRKELTWSGLK